MGGACRLTDAGANGARSDDTDHVRMMKDASLAEPILVPLDAETAALVRVAAVVAGGGESLQRDVLRDVVGVARGEWVEEVLLQSHLFAGFPRALNAMRTWRSVSGREAPAHDPDVVNAPSWRERGTATCAEVYGPYYDALRRNIAELHPALDSWMVADGYGKVLGRPELDLARRELCVVAACVAAEQERQLHSHLHGALHVGAPAGAVEEAMELAIKTLERSLDPDTVRRCRQLWKKVLGRHHVPTHS